MQSQGVRSPHKYILLLTIADLFDVNPEHVNKFPYTEELEKAFINNWLAFFPETDPKQIFLEYPYYHIESDEVWTFKIKNGAEQLFQFYKESKSPNYRFTAKRIKETIEYASLSDDFHNCMRSNESRKHIVAILKEILQQISDKNIQRPIDLAKTQDKENLNPIVNQNPFVSYLNSLQNITPNSENALAESQSINQFFGYIHVPSPKVADYILNILMNTDKHHVILTGHAGDGKSTIGLEIYKKLKHKPHEEHLENPMNDREAISTETGKVIILIKDMSELTISDKSLMLKEIPKTLESYFIISNTGTLLETFRYHFGLNTPEAITFESKLLNAIDSREPKMLDFSDAQFEIINLAQIDNIKTAGEILKRMINPQLYEFFS